MPTAREVWSAGDWPSLSKLVVSAGEATAAHSGAGPGMEVLDVGAGANFERFNEADDRSFRAAPKYLRITAE
jgi:hypothetical protein